MHTIRFLVTLLLTQSLLVTAATAQPATQFAALEKSLLDAQVLSLDFQVSATGAIEVNIKGSLSRAASGDITLHASGVFAGQDVDLIANKRGNAFEYGPNDTPVTTEVPVALWESLLIGFTRMGILHNIANLSAGLPPDHAEGGVNEWVLARNIAKNAGSFTFDIIVSDSPSGSAILTLDEQGKPRLRQQTVAFPGGEMRVVETYTRLLRAEQSPR